MHASALYDQAGQAAGLWRCGVCRQPFGTERAAAACCRCRSCGTACDAGERMHAACRERERQETLAAAETDRPPGPQADLDGHVYLPAWDAYHPSVAAVQRTLARAEIPPADWPAFGYLCDRRPFVLELGASLQAARQGHDSEILERIDPAAFDDLRTAVDRFNEANRSRAFSLTPDLYRKVAIPPPDGVAGDSAEERLEEFRITPAARGALAGLDDDLRSEVLRLAMATLRGLRQADGEGHDVLDVDFVVSCRNIVLTARDFECEDEQHGFTSACSADAADVARLREAVELVRGQGASVVLPPPWGAKDRYHEPGLFMLRPEHVPQYLIAPETFWATAYYGVDVELLREWRAWRFGRDWHRCTGWTKSGRRCRARSKFSVDEMYPAGFRPGASDRCVAHKI